MKKANEDLRKQAGSYVEKMKELQTSRDEEKGRADALEAELDGLRQKHKYTLDENGSLKIEV